MSVTHETAYHCRVQSYDDVDDVDDKEDDVACLIVTERLEAEDKM